MTQPCGLRRLADAVFDGNISNFAGAEQSRIIRIHKTQRKYSFFSAKFPIADFPISFKIIASNVTPLPKRVGFVLFYNIACARIL